MAAKFPLDLSQFKKTKMDKHATTLKHKSGHEVKIIHSALKPELREALHRMPTATVDEPTPQPMKKDIKEEAFSGAPKDDGHGHMQQYGSGGQVNRSYDYGHNDNDAIKHNHNPIRAVKGVHHPDMDKRGSGQAHDQSKESHQRVLGEMQRQEKPNLYWSGGQAQDDANRSPAAAKPEPTIASDADAEQVRQGMQSIGEGGESEEPQDYQPSFQAKQGNSPEHIAAVRRDVDSYSDPAKQQPEPAVEPSPKKESAVASAPEQNPNVVNHTREIYNDLLRVQGGARGRFGASDPSITGQMFTPDKDSPVAGEPKNFNADVWAKAEEQAAQEAQANAAKNVQVVEANKVRVRAGLAPLPTEAAQSPGEAAPAAAPVAAPDAQQPQENSPLTAIEHQANLGQQAIREQMTAAEVEQKAATEQAADSYKAQQDANANIQKATADYSKHIDYLDKQTSMLADELKNGHIDPNQFWNDKSTPNKIRTTIGLMLSGMGAATLGQEPAALKYLQSQIAANVEGQKKMMDVKGNVLNSLLHQYGDRAQALTAYQIAVNKAVESQVQEAALKQGGPRAAAAAQLIHANLLNQSGQLARQLTSARMISEMVNPQGASAKKGTVTSQAQDDDEYAKRIRIAQSIMSQSPGSPEAKQAEETVKYLNEHYLPNIGGFSRPVPPEVAKDMTFKKSFEVAGNDFLKFAQEHMSLGDWADPRIQSAARNKAKELGGMFRTATGVNSSDAENRVLDELVPAPGKPWSALTAIPKVKELMHNNKIRTDTLYKGYGKIEKTPIQKAAPLKK